MASEISVKVIGIRELMREMRAAGVGLEDMKEANAAAALIVTLYAQQTAPKRTGRLAASGRGSRSKGKATVTFGRKGRVPYAEVIHWGWRRRNIRANRWVYRAVDETEPIWIAVYDRAAQKILDKIEGAKTS